MLQTSGKGGRQGGSVSIKDVHYMSDESDFRSGLLGICIFARTAARIRQDKQGPKDAKANEPARASVLHWLSPCSPA